MTILLLLFLWFSIAIFTSAIAAAKGRNDFGWFFLGLLFSVVAFFAVGMMPPKQDLDD